MDWDSLDQVVAYAELEETEVLSDFDKIVSDVLEVEEMGKTYTSAQLPEGFKTEMLDGDEFGFRSWKDYGGERIEVEYRERDDIGFDPSETVRAEVRVDPAGYVFSESWERQ